MLATAAFTAVVAFLTQYFAAQDSEAAKRQIGALEYENLAIAEQLKQAAAAKATAQVVEHLDSDALKQRMLTTNVKLAAAQARLQQNS